jgi:hypothetical protein
MPDVGWGHAGHHGGTDARAARFFDLGHEARVAFPIRSVGDRKVNEHGFIALEHPTWERRAHPAVGVHLVQVDDVVGEPVGFRQRQRHVLRRVGADAGRRTSEQQWSEVVDGRIPGGRGPRASSC